MSATIRTPLFNRYEVLGELGAGGWGTVYEARHKVMGRMVALKVLPPAFREDTEAQERFKREAMVLARFDHPHIARIYDAEIEQNVPYLAMELIEGRDLEKVIADKRRLSVEATIRLGLELAEALDHIHRAGIVHRDIKPSNIVIRPNEEAVLTDFGIAFSAALPRITREVPGTPEYMSPEQVDGRTVDGLSDLYSFGVVLYKCLTGIEPFQRRSESLTALNALIQRILKEDPPSVYLRRPEAPVWLVDVINRCMAKTPADRFPSGQALAAALRAGLPPEPDATPLSESTPVPVPIPAETPDPEPEPITVTEAAIAANQLAETPDPEPTFAAPDQPDETPEPEPAFVAANQPDETPEPEPAFVAANQPDEPLEPIAVADQPDRAPEPSRTRTSSKKARWAGLLVGGLLVLSAVAYATGLFTPSHADAPSSSMMAGTLASDTTFTGSGGSLLPDTSSFLETDEAIIPAADSSETDSAQVLKPRLPGDSAPPIKTPESVDLPDPKPVPLEKMTIDALLTESNKAQRNKAYDAARRLLEEAARRGSAEAHYVLGSMYEGVRGIPANPAQAAAHYRAAADRGHREAQYTLGVTYLRADSGPGQDSEAVQWLEQAAAQGHREAQANLGVLYEEGKRTRRNTQQAADWYKKAALQGHSTAQYKLAEMYREGRSIEPDNQEAFRWYLAAANQNDADAQYWVGRFYAQGRGGVSQSDDKARAWYEKAAAQGQEDARQALARAAQ